MLKRLRIMRRRFSFSFETIRFPLDQLEAHSTHDSDLVRSLLPPRRSAIEIEWFALAMKSTPTCDTHFFYCNFASWEKRLAFAVRSRYFQSFELQFWSIHFCWFLVSVRRAALAPNPKYTDYSAYKQWQRFTPFISRFRRLLNIKSLLPLLQYVEQFFFLSAVNSIVFAERRLSWRGTAEKCESLTSVSEKDRKTNRNRIIWLFLGYRPMVTVARQRHQQRVICPRVYVAISFDSNIRWLRCGGGMKSVKLPIKQEWSPHEACHKSLALLSTGK